MTDLASSGAGNLVRFSSHHPCVYMADAAKVSIRTHALSFASFTHPTLRALLVAKVRCRSVSRF
jgi:hypothetical protein